jgi:hypothetical protein
MFMFIRVCVDGGGGLQFHFQRDMEAESQQNERSGCCCVCVGGEVCVHICFFSVCLKQVNNSRRKSERF